MLGCVLPKILGCLCLKLIVFCGEALLEEPVFDKQNKKEEEKSNIFRRCPNTESGFSAVERIEGKI